MVATARAFSPVSLDRPTCLCGARMRLARIEPHLTIQHADTRTFECGACGHTLRQTFGEDKLASDKAQVALTSGCDR
jgi:hypothetical protein